ncbi:MAG: hypothetical protein WD276_07355 [Actinomycetota bacterium]
MSRHKPVSEPSADTLLRYQQPFVDWKNAVDPSPESGVLSLDEVNEEHTVYLVEVEDEDELASWLAINYKVLFENELEGWYTDPALWPHDRSLELLKRWCSFELHTVVEDTGESVVEDDELGD